MATLPRNAAAALLRPGRAGGDHPARADRRQAWSTPTSSAAQGREPVELPAPEPRADPQAHPRRAALPGAAAADRDGRGGVHRRRGRGAAPRHGLQALGRADGDDRGAAARGDGRARHHRRRPQDEIVQRDHLVRALRLPRVARRQLRPHRLRLRLPQAPPPGGLPTPRSSTPGRWASTTRRPSSRTPSATASTVRPVDVNRSGWRCRWEAGGVRLGLRYVHGLRQAAGEAIEAERGRARRSPTPPTSRRAAASAPTSSPCSPRSARSPRSA